MQIYKEVLKKITETVGQLPAESGGVIALDCDGNIADFYFDKTAVTRKAQYIPNSNDINYQVNQVWSPLGYRFGGVVHSHPPNDTLKPSNQDILMAKKIMNHNDLERLLLGIVQKENISFWEVSLDNQLTFCKLKVLK